MISPSDQTLDINDIKSKEKENTTCPNDGQPYSQPLCNLLRFQALFGLTYCGTAELFGATHFIKRLIMICYDFLLIFIFIGVYSVAFSNDSFDRIFRGATNKGVMSFVFRMAGLALVLEYLTIKVMILVNGKDILQTIRSIGNFKYFRIRLIRKLYYLVDFQ